MTIPYNDIAATRLLHALQDATDPKQIAQLSVDYAAMQPPNSPRESDSPTSEEIVIDKVVSLKDHDRWLAIQTLAEIADLASPADNQTNRGVTLAMKSIAAWNGLISEPQKKLRGNVVRLLSAQDTFKFAANPELKSTAAQAVITIAGELGATFRQAQEFSLKASTFLHGQRAAALDAMSSPPPPPTNN